MAELRWAESAVKDLDNICTYIAEDSERICKDVCQENYGCN